VQLWEELQLHRFWSDRLRASRKGTRWDVLLYNLTSTYFEANPPFPEATNAATATRAIIAVTACRW